MDRRMFLTAGTAVTACGITPAWADDVPRSTRLPKGFSMDRASGPPVFTTGPLADNSVAKGFGLIPDLPGVPDISYDSAEGAKSFADLVGKVRILALWADWCPPCMEEMPELAALQAKHGGDRFEFVAIETGSRVRTDFATARKTLDDAGARGLPLWVEANGGGLTLGLAISNPPPPLKKGPNIPCAVLVDVTGKVRGHMVGLRSAPRNHPQDPSVPPVPVAEHIWPSIWTTPDADAFIDALVAGALD